MDEPQPAPAAPHPQSLPASRAEGTPDTLAPLEGRGQGEGSRSAPDACLTAALAALRHEDAAARAQAAWSLGLIGDASAIDPLVAALTDAEACVREQAAWALGLKGDRRVVAPLLAALDDDAAPVRERAVWALGLKGDERAVAPLVARLHDDHAGVREQAAWALGQRGDAAAVEALHAAADRDPEPAVRDMARWSLAMLDTDNDTPLDATQSGASFGEVVAEALKVIQTGRSDQ